MRAIAFVESSGVNRAPYLDCGRRGKAKGHKHVDSCYAWGLYAFHRPRWSELSQSPWGTAPEPEQHAAIRRFIHRTLRGVPPSADRVTWIANAHNLGHGSTVKTDYVRKVKHHYERNPHAQAN